MHHIVRRATCADSVAVARAARETWHVTYAHSVAPHNQLQVLERSSAPDALAQAIAAEHSWFYVADDGGRVVGFAQFMRRADGQGELARLYVLPDHQRRGIGCAFLASGAEAMKMAGIELCYASVEMDNSPAMTFYRRFGFRRHREHANFLGDQVVRLIELSVSVAELQKAVSIAG